MYTNPHFYTSGQTVNASRLNSDARDNVNAIYSLATNAESFLNPMITGIIGYSSNFLPETIIGIGNPAPGVFVGCVGFEKTTDIVPNKKKEWRLSVSYTMATNSVNGTVLHLHSRKIGWMGRQFASGDSPYQNEIYVGPTMTSLGKKFHVSGWQSMASMDDEVWEIYVGGYTYDSPSPVFSNLNVCFQVRDY